MNALKKIVKAFVPHGLVEMRRATLAAGTQRTAHQSRAAYHEERRKRIAEVGGVRLAAAIEGNDYESVIGFLMSRGLPEHHLREGSVPPKSLEFIRQNCISRLGTSRPLRALHIGNFVGVSLVFTAASLVEQNAGSLVVSIDPNLTHRGISNPQAHVSALVSACGLTRNILIVTGYSGGKSISNDGVVFNGYDPAREFANEFACEESLNNIGQLCTGLFDVVFLDGNHQAEYLLKETRQMVPLLRKGGFVVFDDVDAAWAEIQEVFLNASSLGLEPVGMDGRVGIAQLH